MAVKCILTGQTPSVLDGVTENVQTQIDNKVDKVTGKGLSTEDYTTVEKTKLSGIEEGAQKNTVTSVAGKTGAVTLAASDVGAQPKITVTGILQGDGNGNITAVESIGAEVVTLNKADVGLGNVDNTSDADKPISTATQTALDAKQPSITTKGVLKGDGEGNITAAEEAEVELVELTADSIGAAPKPRILNITLPAANWTGSGPYTQTVTIANGTANTKVDIMFDDTVYQQMVDDQVGYLAIANENGTFTATASGGQPSVDLSIQVECKEVTPPPVMAVKGELLTMNLDGNGNKQYRVLSINDKIAKVLGMSDISTSQVYNATSKTGIFINGATGQLYAGSDLDTYLNTTWYNTLTSTAKAAIVPESRTQYMYRYYDEPNTANTPTYTYQYQNNLGDTDYENANLIDSILVGDRNVFALDLKDIFDYFGKVCITKNELMELWTNQTSFVFVSEEWWLSSAESLANHSKGAWQVNGRWYLTFGSIDLANAVRPAFNIDLSKISYTRE